MLQDRTVGCVFVGLSLLLWFVVLPREIHGEAQILYPRLTVLFMAVPAFFMMVRRPRRRPKAPACTRGGLPAWEVSARIGLLVLLMAACIVLTGVLGFFVANFLCAMVYMRFFGERRLTRVVGVPAALLTAIYVIVVRLLHYPLPAGTLF